MVSMNDLAKIKTSFKDDFAPPKFAIIVFIYPEQIWGYANFIIRSKYSYEFKFTAFDMGAEGWKTLGIAEDLGNEGFGKEGLGKGISLIFLGTSYCFGGIKGVVDITVFWD